MSTFAGSGHLSSRQGSNLTQSSTLTQSLIGQPLLLRVRPRPARSAWSTTADCWDTFLVRAD